MKLAFPSNAYLQFSIAGTIRRIAEIGYTGIELYPYGDAPGETAVESRDYLQNKLAEPDLTETYSP